MKPKIPEEGPHGVDRWTSNGYGLTLDGKTVKPMKEDQPDDIEDIIEIEDK